MTHLHFCLSVQIIFDLSISNEKLEVRHRAQRLFMDFECGLQFVASVARASLSGLLVSPFHHA